MTDIPFNDRSSTGFWRESPHAPPHWFLSKTNYIITASTYQRLHLFNDAHKLDYLQKALFDECENFGWSLQAWAIFSNHYHLIVRSPENAMTLTSMIQSIHSRSAVWLNEIDETPQRKVWYQYRDTCLTYPSSYYARLHYVMRNPEKHGIVANAEMYPWCSMGWFKQNTALGFQKTVMNYKTDKVNVWDDF